MVAHCAMSGYGVTAVTRHGLLVEGHGEGVRGGGAGAEAHAEQRPALGLHPGGEVLPHTVHHHQLQVTLARSSSVH